MKTRLGSSSGLRRVPQSYRHGPGLVQVLSSTADGLHRDHDIRLGERDKRHHSGWFHSAMADGRDVAEDLRSSLPEVDGPQPIELTVEVGHLAKGIVGEHVPAVQL